MDGRLSNMTTPDYQSELRSEAVQIEVPLSRFALISLGTHSRDIRAIDSSNLPRVKAKHYEYLDLKGLDQKPIRSERVADRSSS